MTQLAAPIVEDFIAGIKKAAGNEKGRYQHTLFDLTAEQISIMEHACNHMRAIGYKVETQTNDNKTGILLRWRSD